MYLLFLPGLKRKHAYCTTPIEVHSSRTTAQQYCMYPYLPHCDVNEYIAEYMTLSPS